MAARNVILRKKISSVIYDLYPKSIAEQIVVAINEGTEETLATRLAAINTSLASKVPEQLSENQTFTSWKASVDAALHSDNINFDTLQEIVDWVEEHQDLYSTLVTAFNTTKAKAEANETAISVLNGDASTAGSVAKAVSDATTPIANRVTATESAITTLNGNDSTPGSVAKSIKDVTDPLATRVTAAESAITTLNADSTTAGSVDYKIASAVSDMSADVAEKGSVYASATEPTDFGDYDLWIYLQD